MILHELTRYDVYKNSVIEWLPEIPYHWGINHLKRFCVKITDGAHTSPDLSSSDYPFLTVVNLENGALDFKNCLYTSREDYEKLVRNGCQPRKYDVLYSKDGTISETTVIHENKNFVVGSSFIIITPQLRKIDSIFLCYLLSSSIMRYQAGIYIKGASLPRISIFNIAKLLSIFPPINDQKAIADYLDTKTALIDSKIDLLTQKAIKCGELKQSLISETVTRGLDKTVAMKDSGVEWIGEVPEHWKVQRVKELFDISRGRVIAQTELIDDGIYPVYSSQTKDDGCLGYIDTFDYEGEYITWTTDGVNAGTVFLRSGRFNCTNICGTLKLNKKCNVIGYLAYSLQVSAKHNKRIDTNGAKIMSNEMMFIKITVPPETEQKEIADFLDIKTAHIDRIVQTINTQIEKFKELRKTLINDVVTGKIKVTLTGDAV